MTERQELRFANVIFFRKEQFSHNLYVSYIKLNRQRTPGTSQSHEYRISRSVLNTKESMRLEAERLEYDVTRFIQLYFGFSTFLPVSGRTT